MASRSAIASAGSAPESSSEPSSRSTTIRRVALIAMRERNCRRWRSSRSAGVTIAFKVAIFIVDQRDGDFSLSGSRAARPSYRAGRHDGWLLHQAGEHDLAPAQQHGKHIAHL